MRVAICQPTYFPWLGYFDLMDQVDVFVLLDNVQFEKQSWQQRNRIKTPTGLQWLTVPVVFRGRLNQRIDQVEIRDADFSRKHLRAIELNYARSSFFEAHFSALENVFRSAVAGSRLVELNVRIMEWLAQAFGVATPLIRASTLAENGKRTQLLANLCRKLGASRYISPIGSAAYLMGELDLLESAGVETVFHNYVHPTYKQLFPPFIPFAAAIDLLLNEGERSMEIIRRGRQPVLTPAEVDQLGGLHQEAAREV